MARISARIGGIAESATLKVDAKAKALLASGRPVISFAAGEPDFATPAHVVEAAVAAARDPRNHRYTATAGIPELKEAIAAKTARDSGLEVSPSQVLVTNGGKQSVFQSFATLLDPGDEVIVPAPYWTTYPEAIRLAGGVAVPVLAGADQDYLVTVEQLEAARTPRSKVLLFVSPSNPTGAVYPPDAVRAIGSWAEENGLWVVSDEIYQNLTYDGVPAVSIVDAVPALAARTLLVNGVAKTYAMTGWRVGWMVGPADAITAATNMQSHLSGNVNNVAQRAALAALTGPQDEVGRMREAFDRRRRVIVDGLNRISGFRTPSPRGAFYVYPDVSDLLGRTWSGRRVDTTLELADLLLSELEVAPVPGEAFGPSGFLRFSYALSDDSLREGLARLARFFG